LERVNPSPLCPHWQRGLRQEINVGAKPFFNERVEEHGGGRDQPRVTAKESELAFLERLQRVLTESTAAS
jgi:hypothetical protein